MTKKILRVLNGEAVWPPPVWLMRQAGRFLPEYRAVRAQTKGFMDLCTTPELACEVTMQPVRRFGMDAAILFSDILVLPWALGQDLTFAEGEGPILPPIRTREQIEALDVAGVRAAIAPVLETVRQVRAALNKREEEGEGQATLIGFAGSPFTVACYMIEGGGSKEFAHVRAMAHGEPELFELLMEKIIAGTITYLSAQVLSGAEALMLFDSWSGILSPNLFRKHVIGATARIVAKLRERFPKTPIIGFPRLAGLMLGEYAEKTSVQGVAIDTSAEPSIAASMIPAHIALQGNLDPLAVVAGGAALEAEAASILNALKGRPHIFNLGHGILPQTNPDHVKALVEQIKNA
ncbi:MAG: uroporphyrinogen decarboxylase [Acetobacteraceae bacterium]|nr:uroporphyrinogen decarboxylase [Acetobacteraceae bacterium]